MDRKTKLYAIYAVTILIFVAVFAIDNTIALFIALGALLFLGVVIESTKAKE